MAQLELFSGNSGPPGLPDYTIRESKRAKHVSIKVSVQGLVEVVVPPGFDQRKVPELIEKRRDWILKTCDRISDQQQDTTENWENQRPETIELRHFHRYGSEQPPETWQVQYKAGKGPTICIPTPGKVLKVKGQVNHLPTCQSVLKKWLIHKAHRDLIPRLRQISFDVDLPFKQGSVRHQKTRWASCSSRKDISINCKLLFVPAEMVDYVFVHELCHTVHMNHSKKFWQLVGKKMPGYEQWRNELKTGWKYVPRWAESE